MCGRFTSSQRRETIAARFDVEPPASYSERYNLAPAQRALVVRERDGGREAVMATWGLLPSWAKDTRIAFKMINARAETLTEKPAYRGLLASRRCLVVADGFYEWQAGRDGKREPIFFRLADWQPFGFAGLWTSRTDEASGEVTESCTVITTTPNALVAPVHDRMPVILPADAEVDWLDPDSSKEHALSLLRPLAAELMIALPASRRVNSVRNDDPALLLADGALAA